MASSTNPRDWFSPGSFTDGNVATPLVDGAAYFDALRARIGRLSGSPYLLISGWRLNAETSLEPSNRISAATVIGDAIARGVQTRSMLWFVPGTIGNFAAGHGRENLAFTRFINTSGGEAILDNRLPLGCFASHHQKFMLAGDASGHTAFVGGIDVAPDRWDTSEHDSSPLREPELFAGWHDVQVQVEGPAVAAIWDVFQQRWNDSRPAHSLPAPGARPRSDLEARTRPTIAPVPGATHSIQLLKTFACRSDNGDGSQSPYPFAPSGDYSYEEGLVRAIDNAEHYVYLEDQYFWPCAVVDALADAVRRDVTVILLLVRDYDVAAFVPYHLFLRHQAIQQLRDAERGDPRVFVYHLEQRSAATEPEPGEQIYVHAKTVVIDDRYLAIGSGNINQRSMRTDSELGVAVVDSQAVGSLMGGQSVMVGQLPRAYRKQLWSEHLGRQAGDDPLDADGGPAGFPRETFVGQVHLHRVAEPRFCQPSILPFGLMNARTTCNG